MQIIKFEPEKNNKFNLIDVDFWNSLVGLPSQKVTLPVSITLYDMSKSCSSEINSNAPTPSNQTSTIHHSLLLLKSRRMNVINQILEQILMLELNYHQFFKVMYS